MCTITTKEKGAIHDRVHKHVQGLRQNDICTGCAIVAIVETCIMEGMDDSIPYRHVISMVCTAVSNVLEKDVTMIVSESDD